MEIRKHAKAAADALVGLFFPPHCAACGGRTGEGLLCEPCQRTCQRVRPPFCQVCSEPFHGAIDGIFTCPNCAGRKMALSHAVAPYLSRGAVRTLIHHLKYHRKLFLRHLLSDWMLEGLADERIRQESFDALVPVPLHPLRQREREFNQSEILARTLAPKTGAPVLPCLQRIRNTSTQTRHDRDERMENLRGAFRMRHNAGVTNQRLLLVDDVLTTGSTLNECARVLLDAGAQSVRAITVARG